MLRKIIITLYTTTNQNYVTLIHESNISAVMMLAAQGTRDDGDSRVSNSTLPKKKNHSKMKSLVDHFPSKFNSR